MADDRPEFRVVSVPVMPEIMEAVRRAEARLARERAHLTPEQRAAVEERDRRESEAFERRVLFGD